MQTLNDVKKRLLINLQDSPEIALRYQNEDPLVTRALQAQAGMIADQSQDIDIAIIEPFIKSNPRTILADATNKGILPVATPCQHYIEVINKNNESLTISAGRYFEDLQGRTWRFLQTANVAAGSKEVVLAEQSEIRIKDYQVLFTEPFHQVTLDIQEELSLCGIRIYDNRGENYKYRNSWLNSPPGEHAYNIKTDSMRHIIVEFGDSLRCGATLQSNTVLSFEIIESDGQIDTSVLREASLKEIVSPAESKIQLKFQSNGLLRSGADPLSIEQLSLLSSYPSQDEDATFLSDFDYAVRKAFMARCNYVSVWNEALQDKYYKATLDDINHLNFVFVPKNEVDQLQLGLDIKQYIGQLDTLYKDHTNEKSVEIRAFKIQVSGKLAPVHNSDAVKEEIKSLLLSRYGRGSLASSYFLADGFNTQEIADSLKKNVSAFQDHISDLSISVEDLTENPIKPHQWVFMTKESITVNVSRTATSGAVLWTS
ncbi:hypothetical protein [Acinetobacter radioresistens]|uniref:hypothetical protein n=1 Tax=Acinetobacter radioresistens TaxID=40216 RepID=UPI002005FBB4|nr:hypothetical protein [Acinetobacter radioresistens]MCK4108911.1 hypothetical protein [Acinetobacter radioresistens]